jgi:hypothetical protein
LVTTAALLPAGHRDRMCRAVARLERRWAVTALGVIALLVYWAARLLYAPHEFARLMRG